MICHYAPVKYVTVILQIPPAEIGATIVVAVFATDDLIGNDNSKTLELQYAGAFNNLWVVRKNISTSYKLQSKFEIFFEEHLLEIKADKFPIGSNLDGVADNYTNHTLQLQKGDCVYLYSDGYADQFGGPKGKKYKYNSLKKLLISIHELPPDKQREKLLSAFESWRGDLEQIDDILVMGVCV